MAHDPSCPSSTLPLMNEDLRDAALAKFRRGEAPGDVAAVFDRETGNPGLDGRRWRLAVTNGERVVYVEAELSGTEAGGPRRTFDVAILEAAVERRIARGYYRREWLIDELATGEVIRLQKEDLRPHPKRPESVFF
jgi:hypothetical protein